MTITRRDAIKTLVISVGGSSLLSACGGQVSLEALAPTPVPRFYSEHEMAVLSRVSDLLLPRTETPGALDSGVPGLLDRLMAEWANVETQADHRAALTALASRLETLTGGDFLGASDQVARQSLTDVDDAEFSGDQLDGYRELKGLITEVYFATEAGADERGWDPAPGRWDPCVDRS